MSSEQLTSLGDRHPLAIPTAGHREDVFASIDADTMEMFDAIAGKIERQPDLLAIPLNNIVRWLAKGHPSSSRLQAWKSRIETTAHSPSGFDDLLFLLRDSSPEAMKWKGFSPFAGVLTSAEVDALQ